MTILQNLLSKQKTLTAKADKLRGNPDAKQDFIDVVNQLTELEIDIANEMVIENAKTFEPVAAPNRSKPEYSFSNFLNSVKNIGMGNGTDADLMIVNEAQGQNSTSDADGGFLVDTQFAGELMQKTINNSDILSKISFLPVANGKDGVRWHRSKKGKNGRAGVVAYWNTEAGKYTKDKMEFEEVKIDLEKLTGMAFLTDEMLQDAPFTAALLDKEFSLALEDALVKAFISGDGVSKPIGIISAGNKGLITVKPAVATSLLDAKDITKMFTSMPSRYRRAAVWLVHPDLEASLSDLNYKDGDGKMVNVYMPAGGLSAAPYDTIKGKQVIITDECSKASTPGDIAFVDFSEYQAIRKNGVKKDWSIHVRFDTGEVAFRISLRANGQPTQNAPIEINNSTNKFGAYIVLGNRKLS